MLAVLAATLPGAARAGTGPFDLVGSATGSTELGFNLAATDYEAGAMWRRHSISLLKSFKLHVKFQAFAWFFPQADGLAIVIQTDGPAALGQMGGGIGYLGLHGVAAVMQTATNNRLGLSLDGDPASAPPAPADLGMCGQIDGSEILAYDATRHVLSLTGLVRCYNLQYPISETRTVDLVALLGQDTATIGVTAGTGSWFATHRVMGWNFQVVP